MRLRFPLLPAELMLESKSSLDTVVRKQQHFSVQCCALWGIALQPMSSVEKFLYLFIPELLESHTDLIQLFFLPTTYS